MWKAETRHTYDRKGLRYLFGSGTFLGSGLLGD